MQVAWATPTDRPLDQALMALEPPLDESVAHDEAPPRRSKPRLISPLFALVTGLTFSYFLAVGALQPTLPRFVEGPLGGSELEVGLVIGAFAFAAVVLRPLVGPIGDRRGRRLLIVVGSSVVAVSMAGYVLAESLWVLVALRLLTGVGEAFFYVGAATVINDLAPDERRGEAVSYFSLALYSGLTFGPVLGERTLEVSEFDTAWLVAALCAGIAAVMGLAVRDTRPEGATDKKDFRWFHPAGLLPGTVLAASIVGLGGFASFIPLYALDLGMTGSRMIFVTFSVVVLLIRSLGARLPDILGVQRAARTALVCQATGLTIMGTWQAPAGLYVGAGVFGVGQALAFPALMTMALRSAPPSERSAVVGTFTAFFDASFGFGAIALGGVAALFGYGGALITGAVVALSGLLLLVIRSRRAEASRRTEVAAEAAPG